METENRKYHVNPETGRPNICRATVRSCKYAKDGQMPPHFDTKDEAKDFHAKQMAEEHDTFSTLKKNDDFDDDNVVYDTNEIDELPDIYDESLNNNKPTFVQQQPIVNNSREQSKTKKSSLNSTDVSDVRNLFGDSNVDELLEGKENRVTENPFDNFEKPKPVEEKIKKAPTFRNSVKIDNRSDKTVNKTINHYKKLGFTVGRMVDADVDFYHSPLRQGSPKIGEIRSYDPSEEDNSGTLGNKPYGVLWLASGNVTNNGEVTTSWGYCQHDREWNMDDKRMTNSKTDKAIFHKNTVVLELNEDNVRAFTKDKDRDNIYRNISPMTTIDWKKMQDSGVDVVRVNGEIHNNYFYGYDCDSLIVLNGDSIVGWEQYEKSDTFDEYEYKNKELSFKNTELKAA